MTASRNPDRLLREFLAEGQTELPDQVCDAIRDRIEQTPQRAVIGSWGVPDMNKIVGFGLAAAAVVIAAFIGGQILNGTNGANPPGAEPSVTQSPAPSASPAPPDVIELSRQFTILEPGTRYSATDSEVTYSFAVPVDGWQTDHLGFIGHQGSTDLTRLHFFVGSGVPGIFTDACAHEGLTQFDESAAGAAEALASEPGSDLVGGPSAVTIDARSGVFVAISVPADIGCSNEEYWLQYDPTCGVRAECTSYPTWLGSRFRFWVVDLDGGQRFEVTAESQSSDANPDLEQEIQQIVDSIQFE